MASDGKNHNPGARLAGVIGWPIAHSRSPRLHGYWLKQHAIDGYYVPLAVEPKDLALALAALPKMGFAGVNLTLPHKELAVNLVDRIEPLAARIGAVNTIVVAHDGKLEGRNTDAFGFIEHLRSSAPHWKPAAAPVALIGAGGAARAIVAALLDAGVPQIRIANRGLARAQGLAREFGAKVIAVDWDGREGALDQAGLLVNSSSLGMAGGENLALKLDRLPKGAIVYDIVYTPLLTPLLAAAKARGLTAVDGLGMLLHQARPAFEAFFGRAVKVDEGLRAHVAADLAGRG